MKLRPCSLSGRALLTVTWAAGLAFLVGASRLVTAQEVLPWALGDVFVAVGSGQYQVYHNVGTISSPNYVLVGTLSDGLSGQFTTGCAFDVASNLYTTDFTFNSVVKFDGNPPHAVLQTIDTTGTALGANSLSNESIVFAANGDFLVGHAEGDHRVHRYNAAGTLLQTFAVATENRGSDWIDLASDQRTLFYTSEGHLIKRFNLSTSTQLADFANLPGNFVFSLRLLPPFDGTGGLLVASLSDITRLGGSGNVVQTYSVNGETQFFSLSLDANGTSFWAGAINTGNFYRFNINSGAVEVGPISTGAPGSLGGLCVKGQPSTVTTPPLPIAPGTTTTFTTKVANQTVQLPSDTIMGGAAFMQVSFIQVKPSVFNSTRLPATSTNTWSGGKPVPPGTTGQPIAGAGGNVVIIHNACFDANLVPILPCNIIAPTTLIQLTSTYQTPSSQPRPGLIIASDGGRDWADITDLFIASDPRIGGGTRGINSDEVIVNLGIPTPIITGHIIGKGVQSPGVLYVDLQLTNTGLADGQNLVINRVLLRTLSGSGTVTYNSPPLPISLGNLSVGASTTVRLFLNVPSTVRQFSIAEAGKVTGMGGTTYSFSISQSVIP